MPHCCSWPRLASWSHGISLSDEKTSKIDDGLIGDWRIIEEHSNGIITISKSGKNRLEATAITDKYPCDNKDEKYFLFTTNIGQRSFMSVKAADLGGFLILQYSIIDKNTLVIRDMNEDKLAAAIGAKNFMARLKRQKGITGCLVLSQFRTKRYPSLLTIRLKHSAVPRKTCR